MAKKRKKQQDKKKALKVDLLVAICAKQDAQAAAIAHLRKKNRKLAKRLAALESSCASTSSAAAPKADDLTKITGIGRAIQRRFQAAGVSTYAQLAGMNAETRTTVISSLGSFEPRTQPELWVQEARRLAKR